MVTETTVLKNFVGLCVYKGRKKKIDENRIRAMKADGYSVTDIAEFMGVSRMTVYRSIG